MRKKLLSLAMALALCLGLTVPAYAAGDFTIEDGVLTEYHGPGGAVVIPDGVTKIGEMAFNFCENLTSVTIPDGVISIGKEAFAGCYELNNVTISDSVVDFGPNAFAGTPWLERLGDSPVVNQCLLVGPQREEAVVIPDGITAIGGQAFYAYNHDNFGDAALKSVTIPDSMTTIGESAFQFCQDLTDVTIPNSVTNIEETAFWDCRSLTSFIIPSGMRSIKRGTFAYCSSLSDITIPSNITEIGNEAFAYSGLTSISIPNTVKSIGQSIFDNCPQLTSASLPNSIDAIPERAFSYCPKLTNVTIPVGVTHIGDSAFMNCTSLTNITIPSSVTEIEESAFSDCTNLASVTIPASVVKIGEKAFHDWMNRTPLPKVTIHGVAGSYAETYAKANNIPFVADAAAPAQPSAPSSPTKFTDVPASSPFANAIAWAVEKNITAGKTATTFAPGENCTNGQILTFLWRANGSPEPTIENPFTDSIPASFQKAAVWAYEKGLVSGTAFGAATPCTRAVTVEYLWKAAGSPAPSAGASFADVSASADYAQAVAWAVENGVTSGTGNGNFSPAATCTRGQIVTFLYRALEK